MRVEDVLRDIQSDRGNVLHGRLLQVTVRHRYLGTQMPSGASTPSPKTPTQLSNGCRPMYAINWPAGRSGNRTLSVSARPRLCAHFGRGGANGNSGINREA